MKIKIFNNKNDMGRRAAEDAADIIKLAIQKNGLANIIMATGTSQFEILSNLIKIPGVDWLKVAMFHLDEYYGLPETHPASFRKYLKERFINKIRNLREINLINGENPDPVQECKSLGEVISKVSVDIALVGIGENGHLAFNDPPADFITEEPYIIVKLDSVCRLQQLGEGWFNTLEEVPQKAISMSIRQIMKSKSIICSVPDKRKAQAVKNCLTKEVSNLYPASILQKHPKCNLYLDRDSASLLEKHV